MSRSRGTVASAIKKGFAKKGLAHDRAARIHRLLIADGPLSAKEISEALDLTSGQITGSDGAMNHLLADGRAYHRRGRGSVRMYYATEEDEEVPCNCVGLSHRDTCLNWRPAL